MLLAVDTSTAQMGLALYDNARVIGEYAWHSNQRHTVELAPALADLMKRTGLKIKDVQALGVALGPGSFTSLRVGLAFVKGLSLARHLPLIGIPTLDILAHAQAASKHRLAVVLQAGRGRLAVGWYKHSKNRWQAAGHARIETVNSLAEQIESPTIVCGELSPDERQRLADKSAHVILSSPAQSVRRPAVLAELAWARWQENKPDDAASLAPIYLHVNDSPV